MTTCEVKKIDSNSVGLNYAEEECLGQLPSVPKWQALEPNSFSTFGGELSTVTSEPLSISRQNKKGTVTGISVSAGFNADFKMGNFNHLLEGVFFAETREKSSYQITGEIDFEESNGVYSLTSTTVDFSSLGLVTGEWIFVGGDTDNSRYQNVQPFYGRVSFVNANTIVFDNCTLPEGLSAESGAGKAIEVYLPRVLKNEATMDKIVRKSYTFERTLGLDLKTNEPQAEYIRGAVAGEFSLDISQEEMLKCDLTFTATDTEYLTGVLKSNGNLTPAPVLSGINTTSNVRLLKLSINDETKSTSTPLFAYVTDASLNVNNNLSENKAIGVFGAIDVSAGNFVVEASTTAYFTSVEAVDAVRKNVDAGLTMIFGADKKGFIFDVPLVGLSGGTLQVEKDNPITIDLTANGAENKFGYTMMYCYFEKLPEVAM